MGVAEQRDERYQQDEARELGPAALERRSERRAVWIMAGLTLVALVLRFWHLGSWNFQATEIFTLRDTDGPHFSNPRPLGYVLNYYLIRPFLPVDEFSLRLLPAICGVLAIPVLYAVARRLVGTGAALFSCLLLTVSPLHVMYSQLARYWALVFLLCLVYPYTLYLGARDRKPGVILLGILAAILASLAHPVAILLLGGPALVLAWRYLRPSELRQMWTRPIFRWGTLAAAVIVVMIAIRFVPILQGWISEHDNSPGGGQFLNWIPGTLGVKQVAIVLAYLESLTVPVGVAGIAGTYLVWREHSRSLGLFLTSVAVFPVLFLTLLSLRTPISQYYLLPTTPVFLLGAGVFLDHVARLEWSLRPRWLVPGTLAAIFVASAAPTLFSDLRDGRRWDFRGAAQWLKPELSPGDLIFSDQYMVLSYYLPGAEVRRLRDRVGLREAARELDQKGHTGALWIVAPAPSHPFRTNLRRGGLVDWLQAYCQLRHTRGVGRVDLRQHYLQVYRCPPTAARTGSLGDGNRQAVSSVIRGGDLAGRREIPCGPAGRCTASSSDGPLPRARNAP